MYKTLIYVDKFPAFIYELTVHNKPICMAATKEELLEFDLDRLNMYRINEYLVYMPRTIIGCEKGDYIVLQKEK